MSRVGIPRIAGPICSAAGGQGLTEGQLPARAEVALCARCAGSGSRRGEGQPAGTHQGRRGLAPRAQEGRVGGREGRPVPQAKALVTLSGPVDLWLVVDHAELEEGQPHHLPWQRLQQRRD